jgi:hypothetical protein
MSTHLPFFLILAILAGYTVVDEVSEAAPEDQNCRNLGEHVNFFGGDFNFCQNFATTFKLTFYTSIITNNKDAS